ncbi:MAG: HAMP domain-containing histidine kinase [Oscillospiraceae bacterium]|nr:HAMP domain-containing histidine kinase [Oscillospiraceae bacterium]
MIRQLRFKLTAITMVLLTVLLALILFFANQSTRQSLRSASMEALEAVGSLNPHRPGRPMGASNCFVLELKPDGTFIAMGPDSYDLDSSENLLELLNEAAATGNATGELSDRQLRYLRIENGPTLKYAFSDISAEIQAISRLNVASILIFALGILIFLLVSVLLSRWAVRPVEQAWNQQRQFVADASHELKTPLTVILTNAELLGDPAYDAESKQSFSANILTMSQQMRSLVEELLDQARVDNGTAKAERQSLDFSKLAEEAVLPFEPVYFEAGRNLVSQISPGIHLTGSEKHLRQVVEILLDNGCKYSTAGGTILLRLDRHGKNALLSVTTPGQPLTEQQRTDIFKRFYRVDAARTRTGSYGLGLSIAQGIVEQHGGKIWAQSQETGNTFFVLLPV